MRSLFLVLLLTGMMSAVAPAQDAPDLDAMSTKQIAAEAATLHPSALYVLAARLLAEGRGQEAANWMYAGQLRYRFMLRAGGEGSADDETLFAALSETVGRPVNEYIAGDVDEWLAAMQWALDWDEANDNALTSKTEHAATLEAVRAGLLGLMAQVEANRENIPREREANGLPNR